MFLVLILFSASLYSQEVKKQKKAKKHTFRVMAGPVLSFYQNNTNHTANSRAGYAFYGAVFEDFRMHKNFSFMSGLEYDYHGVNFNSYYLTPSQFLYDKHFDYNYRLRMQEIRLNVMFKQNIGLDDRNVITGYTACGYVLRYLMTSHLNVNSNLTSEQMFSGKPDIVFEHPVFRSNMASAVKFVVGGQRNFFNTHRAVFFECAVTLSLSRFYLKESFAPSSLYINGSFVQIGLGVKI